MYTALIISVEISDQYGTSEHKFIGIFDNPDDLKKARDLEIKKYRTKRMAIKEFEVAPNQSYEDEDYEWNIDY